MYSRNEGEMDLVFSKNQLQAQMEFSLAVNQRKIYINEIITDESVFKYIYYLNKIVSLDKKSETKEPIEIYINSDGGSVYDGFALISYLESLKDEGYEIITINIGKAFSMAFLISLVGTTRKAYRYARYMYHELSGGMFGKFHSMEEDLEESKQLMCTIVDYVIKYTNIDKDYLISINEKRQDKFFSAEELRELKGVDIIV